jgi:predicted dehydrogenase
LKVRQVVVVGSQARVVFDDTESLERVKVFEKGVGVPTAAVIAEGYGDFRFLLRDGDIVSPRLENSEPLKAQCAHFLQCAADGATPLTDGASGVAVVRALEAADQSMAARGARIALVSASSELVHGA